MMSLLSDSMLNQYNDLFTIVAKFIENRPLNQY
jgi:hypothetical protein